MQARVEARMQVKLFCEEKAVHTLGVALLIILTCLSLIITLFLTTQPASANPTDTSSTTTRVKINSVVGLSIASCTNPVDLDNDGRTDDLQVTLQPGKQSNQCQNVAVDTNASAGYSLSLQATGTSNNGSNNTSSNDLVHTAITPNPPIIPATTAGSIASPAALAETNNPGTDTANNSGTWGFAVPKTQTNSAKLFGCFNPTANTDCIAHSTTGSGFDAVYETETNLSSSTAKYAAVPTTPTTLAQTNQFSSQTDAYNLYFASRVPANKPAGSYITTITYTVVGEEIPEPLDYLAKVVADNNITTMQGLTTAVCQNTGYDNIGYGINANNTVVLTDTRDGRAYTVRKLADNKCWMIDNLKLKLTSGMVLTTTDSAVQDDTEIYFTQDGTQQSPDLQNMDSDFFTTDGFLTRDSGSETTGFNFYAWRQVDPGPGHDYCRGVGTDDYDDLLPDGNLTGCGYLYNFYTATASTSSQLYDTTETVAPSSICPANWRLPTDYDDDPNLSDFAILNDAMADDDMPNSGWQPDGPFRGVFSGGWQIGWYDQPGSRGYLWSSSIPMSSYWNAYYISFDPYSVNLGGNEVQQFAGYGVRCVVGS
jgi:hypothetical protein